MDAQTAKQKLINAFDDLLTVAPSEELRALADAVDDLEKADPATYRSLLGITLVNDLFRIARDERSGRE